MTCETYWKNWPYLSSQRKTFSAQQRVKRYCEVQFDYKAKWSTVGSDVKVKVNPGDSIHAAEYKEPSILIKLKKAELLKAVFRSAANT